uniref:Galectin n=1 Tax=Rhabditophanes sp. KR3021 TaxID=114890 RepID=A0AC35TVX0_9BILA
MHTINDPVVPFTSPIWENISPGSRVVIHGKPHHHHGHAQDFAVELISGSDVYLHANFRFKHGHHKEHHIVMNSCIYNSWAQEIRVKNPIHNDDHFVIIIEAHASHFDIAVNGHSVASFNHRGPYQAIRALGIKGEANISKVHFEGFSNYSVWGGVHDTHSSHYSGYGTASYNPPTFNQTF